MKANRRSFLGFLGGAAATGPKLVQSIASDVMGGPAMVPSGSGMIASTANALGGDWKLNRIADIKRLLGRGETDVEKRERRLQARYQMETVERYRLDGLRSVSAQHKMRMFIEGASERQVRLRRESAEIELETLINLPF